MFHIRSRMRTNTPPFFFCCARSVVCIMAEENVNVVNNDNPENDKQDQSLERLKRVDALLSDKELKDLLIQKLLDGGHVSKGTTPNDTNAK